MSQFAHNGYVVIDKDPGMTSHDVVAKVRARFSQRRVGHGGTLDPDATGVLVVALGAATRLLSYCSLLDKSYEGEFVLGSSTDTLDASGKLTGTFDMSRVTAEEVRASAESFLGLLEQVPPMVSAVQVGGKRLHELARAGIEVERAPRRVEVSRFEVAPTDRSDTYRFVISCSSGTYVRALCDDLGRALGGGAHLSVLRRTAIGQHDLSGASRLIDLEESALKAPYGLVSHLETLAADGETVAAVLDGKVLASERLGALGPGPFAVCSEGEELLAVYERVGPERVKPSLVLSSAQQDFASKPSSEVSEN